MKLKDIQTILAPCHQRIATEDISLILEDMFTGGKFLPPVHLSGFAGLGKSFLLSKISEIASLAGFDTVEIPVGCSSSQFLTILVNASDKETVLIADESHALKCVQNLKVFSELGNRRKEFTVPIGGEDFTIIADPTKWFFITASNETPRDSALVGQSGRFRNLPLVPYNPDGRASLLSILAKEYGVTLPKVGSEGFALLVNNVRPFARSIRNLLIDLATYCRLHGATVTSAESVKKALANRGYFPQGYTRRHIAVLRYIASDAKGKQVQDIAANPCEGASSKETSDLLSEMLQGGLVATLANGRKGASQKGVEYLTSLSPKKVTK